MNLEINRDLKKEHRSSKPRAPDKETEKPKATAIYKSSQKVETYKSNFFDQMDEADLAEEVPMKAIELPAEEAQKKVAYFRKKLKMPSSEMALGRVSDQSTVLVGMKKDGQSGPLNTDVQKTVNLNRAKPLYQKAFATYSEGENRAFCQRIEHHQTSEHFLKYLEEAAIESETKDVKAVFPFMGREVDAQKYRSLLAQKEALKKKAQLGSFEDSESMAVLKQDIEALREKMYQDQYRRIQFKKQLDQLLKSQSEGGKDMASPSETFWFWSWIKKLLHAVEEEIEATIHQKV